MSKTIPLALVNCGTLVFGVRVVRADATVLAWTDHDQDQTVTVGGTPTLLLSNPGFTIQSLVSTAGLGVDNTEIHVIAGDDLTRADILSRKADGAQVYFFRYSWKAPAAGIIPIKRGSFGNFKPRLAEFIVEFRDLRQALQPNSTWVLQETCRNRHGGVRCGRDLTPETFSATVTAVTSQTVFTAAALIQADDYFGEGFVNWTGVSLNEGTPGFKVKEFAAGVVTLSEAPLFPVQVGDTFTAVRGCRKRFEEDCKPRGNARRFGGEKDKPTRDSMIAAPQPAEI